MAFKQLDPADVKPQNNCISKTSNKIITIYMNILFNVYITDSQKLQRLKVINSSCSE